MSAPDLAQTPGAHGLSSASRAYSAHWREPKAPLGQQREPQRGTGQTVRD